MGFGVWGLGFGVWGLGFGVWGLGFGVWGLRFGVWAWGLEVRLGMLLDLCEGLGFREAVGRYMLRDPLVQCPPPAGDR